MQAVVLHLQVHARPSIALGLGHALLCFFSGVLGSYSLRWQKETRQTTKASRHALSSRQHGGVQKKKEWLLYLVS